MAPWSELSSTSTPRRRSEHILAAALHANIARIDYLSALVHDTADRKRWWVLDVWKRALARIKSSGIPYTIFYPSNFMEMLAQRHVAGQPSSRTP